MPACFNCQTPYEEGQKFCMSCGTPLIEATARPKTCQGCGSKLSPDQAFCHECGAAVDVTPKPARLEPPSGQQLHQRFIDRLVKGSPAHILALIGGWLLILIVLALGISWFTGGGGKSSQPGLTTQGKSPTGAQKPSGEIPTSGVLGPPYFSKATDLANLNPPTTKAATATAPEQELSPKEEMEKVLFNLRKGQEEKDLTLYMSCFSSAFPNLDQKRESVLENWKKHEFSKMFFNIEEIQEVAPDSHIALVTWDIQTRNLDTQKTWRSSQKFKVYFVKEGGRRLIKSLDREGKEVKEENR